MASWRYEGDITGFIIVGQSGGSNANFLGVNLQDPKTKLIYDMRNDARGWIYTQLSKTQRASQQKPLTTGYDIRGARIINFDEIGDGYYSTIFFKKGDERFQAVGPFQGTIKIYPLNENRNEYLAAYDSDLYGPEDRKKKSIKTKTKRKTTKPAKRVRKKVVRKVVRKKARK